MIDINSTRGSTRTTNGGAFALGSAAWADDGGAADAAPLIAVSNSATAVSGGIILKAIIRLLIILPQTGFAQCMMTLIPGR
jgi:hypothetical protein